MEMEELRNFKLAVVSANNLPDSRMLGRMKVYAKVSVNGIEKCSPVDEAGETNPRWNCGFEYNIKDSYITRDVGLQVVVALYCERSMGDKLIGEVRLRVKGLFDNGLTCAKTLTYDVNGTTNGKLNIRYSFGGVFLAQKQKQEHLDWKGALTNGAIGFVGCQIAKGVWCLATGDSGEWIDAILETK